MTKREMGPMLRKYKALDDKINELKQEKDKLNAAIKAAMLADGLDVFTAGGHAAMLTHRAGAVRVDSKALKRDLPEVAARYSYQGAPTVSLVVKAIEAKAEQ